MRVGRTRPEPKNVDRLHREAVAIPSELSWTVRHACTRPYFRSNCRIISASAEIRTREGKRRNTRPSLGGVGGKVDRVWKKTVKRIGHILRPRCRRLVKSKRPSWSARWRSSRGNLARRRISSSHGIFEVSREIDVHVGLSDYPTIQRPHEQCVDSDPRTNGEPTQARRANDIRHCSRLSSPIR